MQFSEFAQYLKQLEETPKRLEITDILADMIKKLDKNEVDKALYLSLGSLRPPFDTKKFNIAEKMMIRAVSAALDTNEKTIQDSYKETGDLGDTYTSMASNNHTKNMDITQVHTFLSEIADIEGTGSQEAKISKSVELLSSFDNLSAKYVVRIILGTTRLGFTELTIIEALSQLVEENKNERKKIKVIIEDTYMRHPDIGLIAKIIKSEGIKGLEKIDIETGIPIFPQKCQRVKSAEEALQKMDDVWAEYKFDGTRVQLHYDKDKQLESKYFEQDSLFDLGEDKTFVKTFTRNLEETTHQFPEIIEAAKKHLNANSVIIDGEAIGYDKETGEFLPFQEIMQRKRKHGIKEAAKEIPIKYYVFDILYLNGKTLIDTPLLERRKLLLETVRDNNTIIIDEHLRTQNPEELQDYFELSKEKGLEGLVVKKSNSTYKAGARDYTWVKLKVADEKLLSDTVDCVVLGYYFGRGARASFGIGGFLAGIYDEDNNEYLTITKVGTGLSDEDWKELKSKADKIKITEPPKNLKMEKIYTPDVWVQPEIVVELGADEISKSSTHTAGYALRFPRLIRIVPDKNPTDTTGPKETKKLYDLQKRASY